MTYKKLNLHWRVFDKRHAGLSESPVWDAKRQGLWWVDIPGKRVLFRGLDSSSLEFQLSSDTAALSLNTKGDLIIAARTGIFSLTPETNCLQLLAEPPYDPQNQRFNDGKADAFGNFVVTTLVDSRATRDAALYRFHPTLGFTKLAGDMTVGNGVAFTADGKTIYWSDTKALTLYKAHYSPTLVLTDMKPFWICPFAPGRPDGCALDIQGHLWVALFEGAALVQLSPQGECLAWIDCPVQFPTMIAFGGKNLQQIYLTSKAEQQHHIWVADVADVVGASVGCSDFA